MIWGIPKSKGGNVMRKTYYSMFCFLFSIAILLGLSACSSTKAYPPLDAEVITSLRDNCKDIFSRHIDAWDSREAENLRLIYTDDIVNFEGEPLYTGIDEVVAMAKERYLYFPNWQMKAGETYISKNECFGTWVNWFNNLQDNVETEFDLLQTQGGKISFWRLFFDEKFYRMFGYPKYIKNDFLAQYASSWSSGKTNEILKLYSTNATLEDTLFGISISGEEAIGDYADSILAKSSGANWELIHPFAEGERDTADYTNSHGGVYAITVKDTEGNPCEIRAVVILTPDKEGKIQSQEVFYNADSLIACGWAK
jgi:hypothetical protein